MPLILQADVIVCAVVPAAEVFIFTYNIVNHLEFRKTKLVL